jgi:hypothetical protein
MTVNLIKLCVGAESVEDLTDWIAERQDAKRRQGIAAEQIHVTRMTPKRAEAILDGGSLYWVIRGIIQCRQQILELRPTTGEDGVRRCGIVLRPEVVLVEPRPRGPFQGWRYFEPEDAPPDLASVSTGVADMPAEMRRELVEMGLL